MKANRARDIAYSIRHIRDYLRFRDDGMPEWGSWTVARPSSIPRRLWWRTGWMLDHIVLPTIRERQRWTPEQLSVRGVLPRYLRGFR